MHTSTVLVTLVKKEEFNFTLKKSEVVATFIKGTGNGGRNKNKVETCVVLRHIPTNITIRIDDIFEISYINNDTYFFEKKDNDHICTLRLKNGILHCDYDCAFFDNKGNSQYYLNGLLVEYQEWNKINRINKLLKIKNRITNES